jgi:hypothetical protein
MVGIKKKTLEDMKELASRKGGKCSSTEYIGARTKLEWACKDGHTWPATPDKIQRGTWCPFCAGNVKLTIKDIQKAADKHKGKCLSKNYVNSSTKLKFKCKAGHVFWARPSSVRKGHWCTDCAGKKKKTIEDMNRLAASNKGWCL